MTENDPANIYPSPLHAPLSAPVSPALSLNTSSHLPLPPMHPPGFFENLSRASSLSRIGSDLPPLNSLTPYPPSTPTTGTPLASSLSRRPPPLVTSNLTPSTPHPISPHAPSSVTFNPAPSSSSSSITSLREVSLVKWRTGHAVFFVGALLVIIGLCVGLITSTTTTCKVPYMAYSYYDNYVPYANMECTTHPSGWYAGAPLLSIGLLSIGMSWYFSWTKVQEMKMAAKYQVAMV